MKLGVFLFAGFSHEKDYLVIKVPIIPKVLHLSLCTMEKKDMR